MQAIQRYLRDHREDYVQLLCDYVRFPSVSAQPKHAPDLRACAEWLVARCRAIGLETELHPTAGHPIVVARTPRPRNPSGAPRPHYLVYGHYDVQPPEPFDLWKSPPFEPRRQGSALYARGASDNKGQHLAHLNTIDAFLQTKTELPCDLTFLIEGEEEVGSSHLAPFLRQHRRHLQCDGVVISDTGLISPKHPTLSYGLRGICALEVTVTGPSRDLHSGIFGGSVDNPAMALCQMLAQLRDARGRINIPGFYRDVTPLTAAERKQFGRQPFNKSAYQKFLGVPQLFGEATYTPIEQRSARPTLEINGLTSGYQGDGSKTIIPSWARAKLTLRLVPEQTPQSTFRQIAQHLRKICPKTVRLEITPGHGGDPYLLAPDSPAAKAALRALHQGFGAPPLIMREGGSIPIVNDFKRILGVDTLLLGMALPDDNAHSPNEKFDLNVYQHGMVMAAHLWHELAAVTKTKSKRA